MAQADGGWGTTKPVHFFCVEMLLHKKNGKILLCLPESLQTLLCVLKKYSMYKTEIFTQQE